MVLPPEGKRLLIKIALQPSNPLEHPTLNNTKKQINASAILLPLLPQMFQPLPILGRRRPYPILNSLVYIIIVGTTNY